LEYSSVRDAQQVVRKTSYAFEHRREIMSDLRLLERATNIAPMRYPRLARQLIVGIAISMMVLCQSAAVAAACGSAMPPVGSSNVAAEPCHEAGEPAQSDSNHGGCASQCQVSHTSPDLSKVDASAAIDLPLLTAYAVIAPVATQCTALHEPRLLHATSPPIPILLCRLLN
jgi:hypothetical protein